MGSKILLADDSITIQKVVNLTFTDEGIEVISVSNGDMAERRLQEVDPDLVLADIFMPGKNGYELCEAIKQNPQFRDVPVVLLVGAFEPFNESEARRVKADAHLTKPFESRVLVETVKSLIDKSPRQKRPPVASEAVSHQTAPEPPPYQNARPIAMPAIDLSAMSNPFPPQESVFADRVSASSMADSTPFADSFPNNFSYSQEQSQEPPPAVEFSVDISPSPSEAGPSSSATVTQEFATFEQTPQTPLSDLFDVDGSFPSPENSATTEATADQAEVFDTLSNFDSTASTPLGNFDTAEPFESPAEEAALFQSHFDNQTVDPVGNQAADVFTDFETLEPMEVQEAQESPSFEVDRAEPPANQVKEYQVEEVKEGEVQATKKVEAQATRKFDTNELESPAGDSFSPIPSHSDQALNGNGSADFSQNNKDFSFYQNSSEPDPSLLSTDEPLGDVFNDFLSPDFSSSAPPLALEEPTVSSLPLQTSDPQTGVNEPLTEPVSAEPFTAFEIDSEAVVADDGSSQTVAEGLASQDFSFVAPASQESSPTTETVTEASTDDFDVVVAQQAEAIEVDAHMPASAQFNFYTEPQQEETPEAAASPSASEAVATDETVAYEAQEEEDKFTASDMWEAQTHFTPVSIESVPVAEMTPTHSQESAGTRPEAAVPDTRPLESASPGAGPATEVAQDENRPEKATPNDVGMNKEMMDEIVRQVVSQLSDSVIREIAWEVVPDCVERVVTNLTRQDLSKRL
jgi:CheY-like chemotaxis protein